MAHIVKDRVKETTTTTGTGPFTLAGAPTGFRSMGSVCAVGDTFRGTIQGVDASGVPTGEWQSGTFVYSAANQITTLVVEDSSTGSAVSFSAGTKEVWIGLTATQSAWVREKLTANRTYYVRTDGNDANTGLANTSGGAFLTIQKAVDVVSDAIDFGSYTVTIQVGDGTMTQAITLKNYIGSTVPILQGNTATPANCVISTTGANAISVSVQAKWAVSGFKLQTATSGSGLFASYGGQISFSSIDFGACAGNQIRAENYGSIIATGNYSISGGGTLHVNATTGGVVRTQSITVSITGTPNFTASFASGAFLGQLYADGVTYSGGATGARYSNTMNGIIYTGTGNTSYFPGNAAGTTATGGQYA